MLDDNLNEAKLRKMIGRAEFDTPEDFQNELENPIHKNFFIDEERTQVEYSKSEKRIDMRIMDAISSRSVLIVVGFKVAKDTPKLDELDIQNFHQECKKRKALYGVLITEAEIHFYEYKSGTPVKAKEIPPLNHLDANFEMHMTPEKYQDWLIARKKWVIGIGLIVILMMSISLANARQCKLYGPIKAEINSNGEKVYYLPQTSRYDNQTTGDQKGERRYCEEKEAQNDGFTLAQ